MKRGREMGYLDLPGCGGKLVMGPGHQVCVDRQSKEKGRVGVGGSPRRMGTK